MKDLWTTGELFWWVLVALLLGALLMWLWFRGKLVELEKQKNRADSLVQENSRVTSDNSSLAAATSGLEEKIADSETTIKSLEATSSSLQESLDAATKEAEASAATAAKNAERADTADVALTTANDQAESAKSALASLQDEAAAAKSESEDAVSALRRESGVVAAMQGSLDSARSQVATLTTDLESATAEHSGCATTIDRLNNQLQQSQDGPDTAALEAEISSLKQAHAGCGTTIGGLRDRLAAVETQQIAAVATEPAEAPDKETAVSKVAEIAIRTRGTHEKVEDDLKKIRGVGPKIDGLLKSMDITSFRQVACFETADIAYVTAALDAFPGRIERDDWMSSAAEEHQAKYGEQP